MSVLRRGLYGVLVALVLLSLSACTTKGQAVHKIERAIHQEWGLTPKETNQENRNFSYYLPPSLQVVKRSSSNVILKDDTGELYILFVNENEGPKSNVNYENDLVGLQDADRIETFYDANAFSYLVLKPLGNNECELIIDRGGVKMSTRTTFDQVGKTARLLTKVIHSVTVKQKNS